MAQPPLDSAPNTPPIWCSMCGSVLTQADKNSGIFSCQCEGCRKVLEARARRIMETTRGSSGTHQDDQA